MTMLATKIFFDKLFLWCKKYWQILLGASLAVIVMLLSAGRRNDLREVMELANKRALEDRDAMTRSHAEQISAERARAEEQRLHAETLARKITEVEKTYRVDSTALSKKKRKQLESLLGNDVESADISKGIANIFGTDVKS
jgi:predicted AAA+ superfamily ATPase